MKCDEIMQREDFKKTVDFHGHFCPGVAIGYRVATRDGNKKCGECIEDEI